ncbi:unnamed protein product, partial [Callosobruchus maculatus]
YFKKFIREANKDILERLLRFSTGADIITDNLLTVEFSSSEGFQRAPTAHTCSCTLVLPLAYDTYTDFRCDMNNVLSSNIWIMDIV